MHGSDLLNKHNMFPCRLAYLRMLSFVCEVVDISKGSHLVMYDGGISWVKIQVCSRKSIITMIFFLRMRQLQLSNVPQVF